MLEQSRQLCDRLEGEGVSTSLADARFAKPFDKDLFIQMAHEHDAMLIVEESSPAGFQPIFCNILPIRARLIMALWCGWPVCLTAILTMPNASASLNRQGLILKACIRYASRCCLAVQSKHPLPNLPRRNPIMRKRADLVLVEKKIAPSRQQARHLIMQSAISVAGTLITKPGQLIDSDAFIEISGQGPRWVGRGGEKLARAFQMFALPDCKNIIAADIGASTGGFCDVFA